MFEIAPGVCWAIGLTIGEFCCTFGCDLKQEDSTAESSPDWIGQLEPCRSPTTDDWQNAADSLLTAILSASARVMLAFESRSFFSFMSDMPAIYWHRMMESVKSTSSVWVHFFIHLRQPGRRLELCHVAQHCMSCVLIHLQQEHNQGHSVLLADNQSSDIVQQSCLTLEKYFVNFWRKTHQKRWLEGSPTVKFARI